MLPHALRGVLLDLDGTLYDYESCNNAGIHAACAFLADALQRPREEVTDAFRHGRQEVKDTLAAATGTVTAASKHRLLYLKTTIERLTGRSQPALALEATRVLRAAVLEPMIPFPGCRAFLLGLRSRGVRTAVVTDMVAEPQCMRLIRLGLDDVIDILVTSEEVGHEKPHPASILRALAKLHLRPEDAVMIGDDQRDIDAARAAGVRSIAFRFAPSDGGAPTVHDFAALATLLTVIPV